MKLGDHDVLSGWVRAVVNFSHHFFHPVRQYYPYPLTITDEIMNDSSESEVQQYSLFYLWFAPLDSLYVRLMKFNGMNKTTVLKFCEQKNVLRNKQNR